jgi:hypothetical protein
MAAPRVTGHTVTLLKTGGALVAGGVAGYGYLWPSCAPQKSSDGSSVIPRLSEDTCRRALATTKDGIEKTDQTERFTNPVPLSR